MNKWKSLGLVVSIVTASSAFAQGDIEDINVQLQDANVNSNKSVEKVEDNRIASPSGGVWILNSQTASQGSAQNQETAQIQAQPTTIVEASPLGASRADEIRKARQGAEIQTETMIVEKLEESRLADERRRADRLFGNRWESAEQKEQQVQVKQEVNQAPPQIIQVVPVEVKDDKAAELQRLEDERAERERLEREEAKLNAAKSEIINEIRAQGVQEKAREEVKNQVYVAGVLGVANYVSVDNMQGNGAAGFSVGTLMPNGVIVEGTFMYSNYYIDEFWQVDYFKELDQYNFNLAVKYSPFSGTFRPFVGATAGYTHRTYTDRTPGTFSNSVPDDEEITTSAVDAGLLVGLDLALTKNFTVGTEYRYSRNIVNRSESEFLKRSDLRRPENTTPIEELDYSMLTIQGKFTF